MYHQNHIAVNPLDRARRRGKPCIAVQHLTTALSPSEPVRPRLPRDPRRNRQSSPPALVVAAGVPYPSPPMRLAGGTDIHLNFLTDRAAEAFCAEIDETGADAILVGGDIGEAPSLLRYLDLLEARIARPIYLVLGNHDFYGGSIQTVRAAVSRRCAGARWLTWLNERDVIELTEDTGLIGHDGWADGGV